MSRSENLTSCRDRDRDPYDDRGGFDDYSRYDVTYDRYKGYEDGMGPPPRMTPPPPTAEMVAYEVRIKILTKMRFSCFYSNYI